MYREHPVNIIKYAGKNIWLLIFPLLRGIHSIRLDVRAFYYWLQGAWFDLLVVLVILAVLVFLFGKPLMRRRRYGSARS